MEPCQSTHNSSPASKATESAPGGSHHTTTKGSNAMSFDTIHKHLAEQNYRINLLRIISRETDEKINEFHNQIRTDADDTTKIEQDIERQRERNQRMAAGIEHAKKLTDVLRANLEKTLSTMSEADKAKERGELDAADVIKALREKLVSIETQLVANRELIEVYRRAHAFFSKKQPIADEELDAA